MLAVVMAGLVLVALTFYALLGGADYGGGVWDLLARGPRARAQRDLIARSIAPIWEANHVWLILAVVLLFTCFPRAFSALSIALHVPLALLLVGIVLRGSAFAFRSYDPRPSGQRWGVVFASASLVTPLLLGVSVGAVASGRLPSPAAVAQSGRSFVDLYVTPWMAPFPGSVGIFALVLFAYLAAVYLTGERGDPAVQEDFRRRALASAGLVAVVGVVVLLLARRGAPAIWAELTRARWALLLEGVAAACAIGVALALHRRAFGLARVLAGAQVIAILWGWGAAQYPKLVEPWLEIGEAAAPPITLRLVAGALALGALVLFPSFYVLLRVFKGGLLGETATRPPGRARP